MTELKKDGIRAAMSERTERETLKNMGQRMTTKSQSTTTKLEGSEPTLEPESDEEFEARIEWEYQKNSAAIESCAALKAEYEEVENGLERWLS